ncbi:MAG TPA: TraB/GumN family protein [Longimicrobium sp.]|nr:TraB/GumN family protein [Longimicrobium sp.]
MIKRFTRVAAAALLAAGTIAPAAQAQQPARSLLYRVEGADGATVYMLGSIHLLTADAYPLPQPVQNAYADAERVFFETSLDSLMARQQEMALRGMYPAGKSLRSEIPADLYARVEAAAPALAALGVTMPVLDRMEPWLVALMFQAVEWQKAGLTPEHGVDMHFSGRAKEDGKPVGGLEPVELQLGLFDGMTAEEQVSFLRQSLEDAPRTAEQMREIVAAWRAGDAARIDAIMNESMDDSPALYARMLTDRNAAWVPQIEALLRGRDDVLVVVGAAHLVGEQSVVSMLRQRGYTVEQL